MRGRFVRFLLADLCRDLGFCLPPEEQERFVVDPPDDVDAFTDAIFVAEGLDPMRADRELREQVKRRVDASLKHAAHAAHKYSSGHREAIEASERCGCFYCGQMFAPGEIQEWVDDGKTAICPRCGIDSVVGSRSVDPITPGFLMRMKQLWFS